VTSATAAKVDDHPAPGAGCSGLWRSRGYGWVLALDPSGYRLQHVTDASLVEGESGSAAEFRRAFDRLALEAPDVLALHQAGDITRYRFDRCPGLPALPTYARAVPVADPCANFATLASLFDEHYAFFDLHGVDWAAVCGRERAAAARAASGDQLFEVFQRMLEPLDDGHVTLAAPGLFHQRRRNGDLRAAMQATFGTPDGRVSASATRDAIASRVDSTLLAAQGRRGPLRQAGNGALSWCELDREVGYLNVLRLFGFARDAAACRADDLPHGRAEVAAFLQRDLRALDAALDEALQDLASCRGLLLDLRFNGGGFDRLGLALAARFADRPCAAFSKRARHGAGHTAGQTLTVEPGRRRFTGPVVALTSPLCVSAGEVLALALRALPDVTLLGQPTAGMLSDNLHKPLPNGWAVSLSNEIYTSHDGFAFEGTGVPPDVPAVAMDAARFVPSLQSALDAGVGLVQRTLHGSSPQAAVRS
jgi:hypothetical protein